MEFQRLVTAVEEVILVRVRVCMVKEGSSEPPSKIQTFTCMFSSFVSSTVCASW